MNLYLVRWPLELRATLIGAVDEEDLLEQLDSIADTPDCTWSIYKGPIALTFDLNATFHEKPYLNDGKYLGLDDMTVDSIPESEDVVPLAASIEYDCDAGDTMMDAILKSAFPNYSKAREKCPEDAIDELKAAVHADLRPRAQVFQRQFEENRLHPKDPEVELAKLQAICDKLGLRKRLKDIGFVS